jgi:hypothetical protein
MDNLKSFLEVSPIASRVRLPAAVVVRRLDLSPAEVEGIVDGGVFSPSGGETCELEVGGLCVARGRILRRGGKSYFKLTELAEGGTP